MLGGAKHVGGCTNEVGGGGQAELSRGMILLTEAEPREKSPFLGQSEASVGHWVCL